MRTRANDYYATALKSCINLKRVVYASIPSHSIFALVFLILSLSSLTFSISFILTTTFLLPQALVFLFLSLSLITCSVSFNLSVPFRLSHSLIVVLSHCCLPVSCHSLYFLFLITHLSLSLSLSLFSLFIRLLPSCSVFFPFSSCWLKVTASFLSFHVLLYSRYYALLLHLPLSVYLSLLCLSLLSSQEILFNYSTILILFIYHFNTWASLNGNVSFSVSFLRMTNSFFASNQPLWVWIGSLSTLPI